LIATFMFYYGEKVASI